ncbi:nuclear transport factor 2 family protein [Nonomuraea sp. NPDC005983]|uniref:nuclear transport factor 2 family protein n=1 Tax=Nonomuraea sp. NPDC005983 TaxID=3155595 RepID=UPI0033AEE8D4
MQLTGTLSDTTRARSSFEGDAAVGRTFVAKFGRMRDGGSYLNCSVYHDRYQRTSGGWRCTERVYEVKYLDATPLTGSASHATPGSMHES